MKIIAVTPQNVKKETLFCVKDVTSKAFECKQKWFEKRYAEGLRVKILKDTSERMIGYVEYVPAQYAWRPIEGENFMFIHCMYVYSKKDRHNGYGSLLISDAEKEALSKGMSGICVMSSKGPWIATKEIFEKKGFELVHKKGRFELLSKKWDAKATNPKLLDWTSQQKKYKGWHLVYADQCPWHEKSVAALLNTAMDFEVQLNITKLKTAKEAQHAPSGFGTFSLLHNGKLLEDHYISATRFQNILKKELKIGDRAKA